MKLRNFVVGILFALLMVLTVQAAETDYTAVGGYMQLSEDMTANWSLTQDLYVDLNGYDLSGTIVTNGYTIYGMDSTTVEYDCEENGYFSCTDVSGQAIVPARHVQTTMEMTGSVRRYMTVENAEGYSFHRFYIAVTHNTLRPGTTGLGYKVLFCGDFMVKRQLRSDRAFSVNLQLDGYGDVNRYLSSAQLYSGDYVTMRIDNWDVENHSDTKLFASVSLYLADGTVISTAPCSATLRNLVEQVCADYERFTKVKLDLIRDMIERNPIMRTWKVDNLFIESYGWVQQPQAGKAYKFGIQIPDGTYYFSGAISGSYYLATTDDVDLE